MEAWPWTLNMTLNTRGWRWVNEGGRDVMMWWEWWVVDVCGVLWGYNQMVSFYQMVSFEWSNDTFWKTLEKWKANTIQGLAWWKKQKSKSTPKSNRKNFFRFFCEKSKSTPITKDYLMESNYEIYKELNIPKHYLILRTSQTFSYLQKFPKR